jgi:hypothetical protein
MNTAILEYVLDLLRKRWRLPEGYSAFDTTFNGPDQKDRSRRPGQRSGLRDDSRGRGVTGRHQRTRRDALQDLRAEVYEAWAKFQARIRHVQAARPVGPDRHFAQGKKPNCTC